MAVQCYEGDGVDMTKVAAFDEVVELVQSARRLGCAPNPVDTFLMLAESRRGAPGFPNSLGFPHGRTRDWLLSLAHGISLGAEARPGDNGKPHATLEAIAKRIWTLAGVFGYSSE